MVQNRIKQGKISHSLSQRGSERSERANERVSAAERMSKSSRAVQANKRRDERVAHYLRLGSWWIWPTLKGWMGGNNGEDGRRGVNRVGGIGRGTC